MPYKSIFEKKPVAKTTGYQSIFPGTQKKVVSTQPPVQPPQQTQPLPTISKPIPPEEKIISPVFLSSPLNKPAQKPAIPYLKDTTLRQGNIPMFSTGASLGTLKESPKLEGVSVPYKFDFSGGQPETQPWYSKALEKGLNVPAKIIGGIGAGVEKTAEELGQGNRPTERVAAAAETALASAQAIPGWAAFTAAMDVSKEVPGLKNVANVIEKGFEYMAEGGKLGAGKLVDVLPIDEVKKADLKPVIEEVGGFASQYLLLHYGLKGAKMAKEKILPSKVAPEVKVELKPEDVQNIKENKPVEQGKFQAYSKLKEEGIDLATVPPEKLAQGVPEVILEKAKELTEQKKQEVIPEIKSETQPIKTEVLPETKIKEEIIKPEIKSELPTTTAVDEVKTGAEKTVIAEPKQKIKPVEKYKSRAYERLQAELPDVLKDDVTYNRIKLKEDVEKATKLIEQDTQKAYNIARGFEEAPEGQTRTSINIALAEKALEQGNKEMYADLTKRRSLDLTRKGQEIVAEKGSVTDNSLSRYVKEVIKERLEAVGAKQLSGLKELAGKGRSKAEQGLNKIDREVKKVSQIIKEAKKFELADAQKLLDSLTCK